MRTLNAEYTQNTVKFMRVDRVLNRTVGIIGLARSGLAAAKMIKRLGGHPFVSDFMPESKLTDRLEELKQAGIPYETGGHTQKLLEKSEYIIVSPGVPRDIPILRQAEAIGIPVFSELEVAYWLCDAGIVAITGSNGKTTTATLLGEILKAAGLGSRAAGNIGYPFSEVCDKISDKGWIALEVSSFQLERIFEFKPQIAINLNLTPDHLDRYGTFEEYAQIKMRIAENLSSSQYFIVNADDDYLVTLARKANAALVFFSQKTRVSHGVWVEDDKIIYNLGDKSGDLGLVRQIKIPGPHNLYNAMAAGAAALLAGVSETVIKNVFQAFPGVEHRLEYVDTVGGVRFINDSKATNIDSVWYALQSVAEKMILILGGKYKGGDLTRLHEFAKDKVKLIIAIGESSELMIDSFKDIVPTAAAESLEQAVAFGYEKAEAGETVLLSPACASFDMFTDFEHRGRVFKEAVMNLKGRAEA